MMDGNAARLSCEESEETGMVAELAERSWECVDGGSKLR